jgi:4-hydroxy-3-polyprenylbenzoate decarboxylase
MNSPRTVTLAFTGASGMPFGLRLLECLVAARCRVYLLYSAAAQVVAKQECDLTIPTQPREAVRFFSERCSAADGQLSGTRERTGWHGRVRVESADAMAVVSMQHGHAGSDRPWPRRQFDRARRRRDVEGAPSAGARAARDAACRSIHLDNMLKLARAGAVILPPAPGFYTHPRTVTDLVDFVVARILDQLRVPHDLVARWGAPRAAAPTPSSGSA